ncbi:MFS transporter [Vagococcus carniphilus]|uniref:MFS transporter n=1 Tax=Vagococcus carniphilus TaxID=218144 RepID=UPI003B5966CC
MSYLNAAIIPVSIIITNWFQKKRGLAMSIAMAGIGVGGFIFSPLVTMWLSHYGWRTTYFIFAAIILTVCLPVSLFLIKKQPSDKGLQPYGADEVDANQTKAVKQQLTISTKESFTKSFFIILIIGMICNGIINSGALGQFPPALEELHGPAISASIISLYSLIGVGGKLLLGWINDKFGIKVSILFGCTAFALAFVCILFGQNIIFAYSMAIVFGLGNAIGTVIPPLVTSAIYGPEQYGDVYGYVSSATQIGLSIGSLAVAATFDMTGSYSSAWVVLAILSVVTMYSWLTAYRKSRQFSATPINE